jgi:hypothetical protein
VSDVNGRRASWIRPVGGRWHRGTGGWSDGPVSGTGRTEGHGCRAVKLQVKIASAAEAARDRCGSTPFRWPSLAVVVVVGSVRRVVAGRRVSSAVVEPGTLRRRSVRSSRPGEPAPVLLPN